MPEKSIDEMFGDIQQALIERTNKYAENAETDIFSAMMLSVSIKQQKQFLSMIMTYDSLKENVKKFHKFVLEDMEV